MSSFTATNTETHVCISICTSENAYPRFCDAILSTKYFDDELQTYYYGYRYYSPELGRWTRRDPIGEEGGLNLYQSVANNLPNGIDALGLACDMACGLAKAGRRCCPECEVDDLMAFAARVRRFLGRLRNWRWGDPNPFGIGGIAGGTCNTDQPTWEWRCDWDRWSVDLETCLGRCIYVHEQRHERDCEGNAFSRNTYFYAQASPLIIGTSQRLRNLKISAKIAIEKPAYTDGLRCYANMLRVAVRRAQRYGGNMDVACDCCEERLKRQGRW